MYHYFKLLLICVLFFTISCPKENKSKKQQEETLLLGAAVVIASKPKPFTISGTVYYSGIVKNARLDIYTVSSTGGCSPTDKGNFIESTSVNDDGSFKVTLPPLGFACYLVTPTEESSFIEVNSNTGTEKPWIKTETTEPYLSAISPDTGNLNITPLTRMATFRFQSLKNNGTADHIALEKSNKEIAVTFFPDSTDSISNISANPLNLKKDVLNQTEKLYLLILRSLSDYILSLSVDNSTTSLSDYEAVYTAYSKDMGDGKPNGTYFNGSNFESIEFTASNSKRYSISTPTIDLKPFIDKIVQTDTNYANFTSIRFCLYLDSNSNCTNTGCLYSAGAADPFFPNQWHLSNTGQLGGIFGEDVHLGALHDSNRGEGILTYIVDDGLQINHEDLKENLVGGSFNVLGNSNTITMPDKNSPSHGTSVAGLIAARALNGIGVSGVAPCAGLAGFNLLQDYNTSYEIMAMNANKSVFVSNNSWGAPDGTGQLQPSTSTWKDAVEDGLLNGRAGKGIVYVWASGNGGVKDGSLEIDNSNYDGQANFYGVTAVSAIGNDGKRASYSENGANVWITSYSQGRNGGSTDTAITTTTLMGQGTSSLGNSNYTNTFNGTSASAPVVSGGIALIFKENQNLTWRDIKLILAKSARKNDPTDSDWTSNLAGYNINHKYGFGSMDINAAVNLAKTWTSVGGSDSLKFYPSKTTYQSIYPNLFIPDNNTTGITSSITISNSNISKIEFVKVSVNISHAYPGDLKIELQRNGASYSDNLAVRHACEVKCNQYENWIFGTARHLEEQADGTWTLKVSDLADKDTGTLRSWGVKFIGR